MAYVGETNGDRPVDLTYEKRLHLHSSFLLRTSNFFNQPIGLFSQGVWIYDLTVLKIANQLLQSYAV